ncbi:DUF2155 domain-containing protein [Plastoroseomonas arctica]|uniref:DUF2155 domain-containing protein n=1 Tax=Plastoroseomonas arctica TaxID=1509237 RepID=A0AAF1JX24_9PROT|nr:DUF2155 domain-containing protein [Plastoroseomonas arctica]
MKPWAVLFLLLAVPAAADWTPARRAQLQALDKVTARVTVVETAVGQDARFQTLSIRVVACHARQPDEVPDAAAFLEISDSRRGAAPVFRGWMFANSPGVNMLEHPVYDIRVLECR